MLDVVVDIECDTNRCLIFGTAIDLDDVQLSNTIITITPFIHNNHIFDKKNEIFYLYTAKKRKTAIETGILQTLIYDCCDS